ncbi:hypothetical protein FBQ97_22060 [Acidobacteria bacterium ACD]|nr:MAG: hypothetical protein EDX89_00985 [Acidobacteriota bacterium]MDL1952468.1 hypothetical protein [Acidobacteria bacterium ACD]
MRGSPERDRERSFLMLPLVDLPFLALGLTLWYLYRTHAPEGVDLVVSVTVIAWFVVHAYVRARRR